MADFLLNMPPLRKRFILVVHHVSLGSTPITLALMKASDLFTVQSNLQYRPHLYEHKTNIEIVTQLQ